MTTVDKRKHDGPDWPLKSAFLAVVLAWIAGLAIISHGVIYVVDISLSVTGLVKLLMVVPMALTAVSYQAVRLRRASGVVWLSAALLVIFSLFHLSFFILVFNVGLLLFPSAFFLFLAAPKTSLEKGPAVQRIVPIQATAWTRLNGFNRRREEPGEES